MQKTIFDYKLDCEEFDQSFKGECSCGEKITCHTNSNISLRSDKKRYYYTRDHQYDTGYCIGQCKGCGKDISTTYKPYY